MSYENHPSLETVLATCKKKIRHLRDEYGNPWATVVVLAGADFTVVGAASCHKRDCFSKKIGRHMAEGRALKGLAEKLGLLKEHKNPMILKLDRALAETERVVVETIYNEKSGELIPTRSVFISEE